MSGGRYNYTFNVGTDVAVVFDGNSYDPIVGGHSFNTCSGRPYQFTMGAVTGGVGPFSAKVRTWQGGINTGTSSNIYTVTNVNTGSVLFATSGDSISPGLWSVEILELIDSNGCAADTTGGRYHFNFTISPPDTTFILDTVCSGTSYNFGGTTYTASGIHSITLTNQDGCDSVVTLNLLVNQPSASSLSVSLCPGGSFAVGGQSFRQKENS